MVAEVLSSKGDEWTCVAAAVDDTTGEDIPSLSEALVNELYDRRTCSRTCEDDRETNDEAEEDDTESASASPTRLEST